MTDIDGPIALNLTKSDVSALKDGETITRELDSDIDGTTELRIEWRTVYESEGAAELFDEIRDNAEESE